MRPFVIFLLVATYCVGYSQSPSTTLIHSALATAAWGSVLLDTGRKSIDRRWMSAVCAWVVAGVFWTATTAQPEAALLVATAVLIIFFAFDRSHSPTAHATVLFAISLAAIFSVAVALLQYLTPYWVDGTFIVRPTVAGRAFANLRQPNQFSTLLLLGICALVWLQAHQPQRPALIAAIWCSLLLGIALSSSRTGAVGGMLLAVWAACDRQLPAFGRKLLLLQSLLLPGCWLLLWAWGHWSGTLYFAEARLTSGSDISSSRFAIWSNTLDLIAAHPWTGVEWGSFNFAWTFTEFPHRPVAFFDHTHNLVLQFAVELGIPATLLIFGALFWSLWHARGALRDPDPPTALLARCCLMMLMLLGWHSMLEYPLWYPYFLFPAAFAFGTYLGIGWPRRTEGQPGAVSGRWAAAPFQAVGVLMIVGAIYAVWDYQRVVQIYAPYGEAGKAPLPDRIEAGRRSTFFGHHADYAAVTTAEHPSQVFDAFERPLRHLVDARLMIAYAKALDELGERDKAVYVAQRLREFRHPLGDAFFKVCETPVEPLPFQCDRVRRTFDYRELYPSAIRPPVR